MFNMDLFIELVKDNPCLWDKKIPDYSDRSCRERAWNSICEEFYEGWVIDDTTKDNKVKDMRAKWRNIRDTFIRSINPNKHGDKAAKRKKYMHAEKLTFILNAYDQRETKSSISEEVDPLEGTEEVEMLYKCSGEAEDSAEDVTSSILPQNVRLATPASQPDACDKEDMSLTPFQTQLLKKLDNHHAKRDKEDGDRLFLLSLLPELRTMHEDDKYDFRIATLQLMRDLKRKRCLPSDGPSSSNS